MAAADTDLSSHHSSEEDSHSSVDDVSDPEKTPWVRSNIQKLRRSNTTLLAGKARSKEKEVMCKTEIDDLKSAVGQLHRDRVDKEIVAQDIEESHRA